MRTIRFTQALLVANGIYYAAAFFVNLFACLPRRKIWDSSVEGRCFFNVTALYISSAVFNTFSDVAMLAVPVFVVWRLQMSRNRKLGATAIFGFGAFATICAMVRIKFQVLLMHSNDITYIHMQTGLLGYVSPTITNISDGILH